MFPQFLPLTWWGGRGEEGEESEGLGAATLGPLAIVSPSHFIFSDTARQERPTLGGDYAHLVSHLMRRRRQKRSSDAATLTRVIFIISSGIIQR